MVENCRMPKCGDQQFNPPRLRGCSPRDPRFLSGCAAVNTGIRYRLQTVRFPAHKYQFLPGNSQLTMSTQGYRKTVSNADAARSGPQMPAVRHATRIHSAAFSVRLTHPTTEPTPPEIRFPPQSFLLIAKDSRDDTPHASLIRCSKNRSPVPNPAAVKSLSPAMDARLPASLPSRDSVECRS